MTEDIAKIAAHMTARERRAIRFLDDNWQAGPGMANFVINSLPGLREAGLVEREIMDQDRSSISVGKLV